MTKAKISEYSATAGDNTDVNGTNIAEGCPPSGINDAIREVMAALKRFETGADGDSVTVGGNLVVSGSTTANTLSTTVLQSDTISEKTSAAGVTVDGVLLKDNGVVTGAGTVSAPVYSTTGDTNTGIFFPAADTIAFTEGGTEAARFDSSGNLLVGTSTQAGKFTLYDGSSDTRIYIQSSTTGTGNANGLMLGTIAGNGYVFNYENEPVIFGTNATERMRINAAGFLKVSNTGGYAGSTGAYHEFLSNQNLQNLRVATNATLTTHMFELITSTSAATNWAFQDMYSGNAADIEFQLRGDGNAYADGSWNGSGADYAEYFESAGETIPRGTTVVLDGNKVRAATASDPASSIMGVVRPKEFGKGSMVVGNLAWNMWTDKYLTDDFGVYEMEDHDVLEWEETITDEEGKTSTKQHSYESHAVPEGVTVPADATRKTHDDKGKKFQHRKLNPAWSAETEYTPREERPEWHIIGLLGQVPVLKGQPVGDRWIKMRDISETVEEWFIR